MTITTALRKKGQFTVPMRLRKEIGLEDNAVLTVIAWEKKAFIVIPQKLKINVLLKKTAAMAKKKGLSLEEMLMDLEEIRHNA